jgi:hypothetical protein
MWLALALAACSRKTSAPAAVTDAATATLPQEADASAGAPTIALRTAGSDADASGLFQWATWGDRRVLLFADADAKELVTLDGQSLEPLGRQPLDGAPSAVRVAGGDVYVTLSDRARLVGLRAHREKVGTFEITRTVQTRAEPVALATTSTELLVLSGFGHALERFSVGLSPRDGSAVTMLPHEPRSLVVLPGGDVVVGHASQGPLTVVRSSGGVEPIDVTERGACKSITDHECDGLVDLPGSEHYAMAAIDGDVLVAGTLSLATGDVVSRYGSDGDGSGEWGPPSVVSFTLDLARPGQREVARSWRPGRFVCSLPRALAVDLSHRDVFVACSGNGRVARLRLDKVGGSWHVATVRGYVSVAGTPLALAVDGQTSDVIVWSREARTLTRLTRTKEDALVAGTSKSLPLATPLDPSWQRGRALFHSADKRISANGLVACAHCHPDGRDDDLVWSTPNGKRRTISLVGVGTASSFGWDGRTRTLSEHIETTIKQRLGGAGLLDEDMSALVAYVRTIQSPQHATDATGLKSFEAAGCASCHVPSSELGDDRVHDLGNGITKRTPRLAGLGGRRTFFHDGRYVSLDAMLGDPRLSMGHARELPAIDQAALRTFLEAL